MREKAQREGGLNKRSVTSVRPFRWADCCCSGSGRGGNRQVKKDQGPVMFFFKLIFLTLTEIDK